MKRWIKKRLRRWLFQGERPDSLDHLTRPLETPADVRIFIRAAQHTADLEEDELHWILNRVSMAMHTIQTDLRVARAAMGPNGTPPPPPGGYPDQHKKEQS